MFTPILYVHDAHSCQVRIYSTRTYKSLFNELFEISQKQNSTEILKDRNTAEYYTVQNEA